MFQTESHVKVTEAPFAFFVYSGPNNVPSKLFFPAAYIDMTSTAF